MESLKWQRERTPYGVVDGWPQIITLIKDTLSLKLKENSARNYPPNKKLHNLWSNVSLSKSHTLSWCHQRTPKASPFSHSHSSKSWWARCLEAALVPAAKDLSRSKNGLTIASTTSIKYSKMRWKKNKCLRVKVRHRIISGRAAKISNPMNSLITNNLSVKTSFMVRFWTGIRTNGSTLSAI